MAKRTRKINLNWHLTHDCPECGSRMHIHPNSTTHNICDDCCDVYEVKRDGSLSFYVASDGSSRSRPRVRAKKKSPMISYDVNTGRGRAVKKVKKKAKKKALPNWMPPEAVGRMASPSMGRKVKKKEKKVSKKSYR